MIVRLRLPQAIELLRRLKPFQRALYFGMLFLLTFLSSRGSAKEILPRPEYDNTFYLFMGDGYRGSPEGVTPYDTLWPAGGLDFRRQMMKLEEILGRLGPDGPYLRLGMADALWPMRTVYPNDDFKYAGMSGLNGSESGEAGQAAELRSGPDPYLNTVIMRSWAQADMPGMLFLQSYGPQEWSLVTDSLAIPSNLTAFLEQKPEAVQRYDDGKICIADNGDSIHTPSDYVEDPCFNGNAPGGTMLTHSRLMADSLRNGYMKRNVQAAMRHIMGINEVYPGLIAAVSIEPESDMNWVRCHQGECDYWADFSLAAVEEWLQWLSHTGIYGPGGEYEGEGADPWFPTLDVLNTVTGSSFQSWSEVDPRSSDAGDTLLVMYLDGGDMDGEWSPGNSPGLGHRQGWCEVMIEHRCEDSVDWLWEVAEQHGWRRSQIFTHQVPGGFVDEAISEEQQQSWGYEHRMCTLLATKVLNGRPGITGFRETTMNIPLFEVLHTQMSQDGGWANLEFNPVRATGYFPEYDNDYDLWLDAYKTNWAWGAHLLAVFRWWLPPEQPTSWANIRPDFHPEQDPSIDFEARLAATHEFISNEIHRFRPWSPDGGSLDEEMDFLPPAPGLTQLEYDPRDETVRFSVDHEIYRGCSRLLWYDTTRHDAWPELINVFGWPEFTEGRFDVHRDTVPGFSPNWANLVSSVTIPQFSFTDSNLPLAGAVFYAVVAVDNQGDRSPDATRVWIGPDLTLTGGDSLVITLPQNSHMDTFFTISNIGLRSLVIDSVSAVTSWLSLLDVPESVPPGLDSAVTMRVSSEGLEAGSYSGTVLISSDDPFEPETQVGFRLLIPLHAGSLVACPGDLVLSPQPTDGSMRIVWFCGSPIEIVKVEIIDLGGRSIFEESALSDKDGRLSLSLNLGHAVGNGVYVIRLSTRTTAVQKRLVLLN